MFYVSTQLKLETLEETLLDSDWVIVIQEELNQFERNRVPELVPRPKVKSVLA